MELDTLVETRREEERLLARQGGGGSILVIFVDHMPGIFESA